MILKNKIIFEKCWGVHAEDFFLSPLSATDVGNLVLFHSTRPLVFVHKVHYAHCS